MKAGGKSRAVCQVSGVLDLPWARRRLRAGHWTSPDPRREACLRGDGAACCPWPAPLTSPAVCTVLSAGRGLQASGLPVTGRRTEQQPEEALGLEPVHTDKTLPGLGAGAQLGRLCRLKPRLCRGGQTHRQASPTLRASFLLSPDLCPARAAEFFPVFPLSQPSAPGAPPEAQLSSQALPRQGLAPSAPHTHSQSNLRLKLSSALAGRRAAGSPGRVETDSTKWAARRRGQG